MSQSWWMMSSGSLRKEVRFLQEIAPSQARKSLALSSGAVNSASSLTRLIAIRNKLGLYSIRMTAPTRQDAQKGLSPCDKQMFFSNLLCTFTRVRPRVVGALSCFCLARGRKHSILCSLYLFCVWISRAWSSRHFLASGLSFFQVTFISRRKLDSRSP